MCDDPRIEPVAGSIRAIATHATLPLVACAGLDRALRIYDTRSFKLCARAVDDCHIRTHARALTRTPRTHTHARALPRTHAHSHARTRTHTHARALTRTVRARTRTPTHARALTRTHAHAHA
eukprot:3027556-Pleurochrysis_carterae.AAC.1